MGGCPPPEPFSSLGMPPREKENHSKNQNTLTGPAWKQMLPSTVKLPLLSKYLSSVHQECPSSPFLVISTLFERLGMGIIGLVEKNHAGNWFLLVITNYATKYPEVFPLKSIKAKYVATCLVQFFSRVGLPSHLLRDQFYVQYPEAGLPVAEYREFAYDNLPTSN